MYKAQVKAAGTKCKPKPHMYTHFVEASVYNQLNTNVGNKTTAL